MMGLKIAEPIEVHITCRSKIRKWAYENAYTLIFVSVYHVLATWGIIFVIGKLI
jgi:hypothetical protein